VTIDIPGYSVREGTTLNDIQAQFSIAEKEEIVAQLREKFVRLRRDARLAEDESVAAQERASEAWAAVGEAERDYNLCERALLEQIEKSL
jgi:hypothetical protein